MWFPLWYLFLYGCKQEVVIKSRTLSEDYKYHNHLIVLQTIIICNLIIYATLLDSLSII